MPHTPHWKRKVEPLRSRADQISDELALDRRIPRLKKRDVSVPAKKKEPVRTTFTLSH